MHATYVIIISYENGISDGIKDIIYKIEECNIDENGNIESKFTNTPISIHMLSEGSKTAIYVYYRTKVPNKKEIINITSCGPNAIKYILENYEAFNLILYLGHFQIPTDVKCNIEFNGTIIKNTSDIFLENCLN
mgnify:CR=1 FL=1